MRRAEIIREIRAYFEGEGFVEVDTPVLVRSPGVEPHLEAFAVLGGLYLNTSPEYQMKRLLAAGFERIYQMGHAFRRDEAGRTHNPEFTILEWYRAGGTTDDLMRDCEALLGLQTAARRLSMRDAWREAIGETYADDEAGMRAVCGRAGVRVAADDDWEALFFRVFVERVEPLVKAGGPTFLTHYPARMAALARLWPDDPTCADRFELYAGGHEIANAFGELTDAAEQRRRFEADLETRRARGLPHVPIDERFLAALLAGLPPCAGIALGVDRLVMVRLGLSDIRDVLAFPFDEI